MATTHDIIMAQVDSKTTRVRVSNFGKVIRRQPLTSRSPDLAVFIKANMVEIDGYFHSPPELLVEVLSPANTRAERERKIRDYECLWVPVSTQPRFGLVEPTF